MSIILNEYEWAERCMQDKDLGRKPAEALSRVARYLYESKYTKREIRKRLDTFLLQCNPNASLISWSNVLDKIAKNVNKYKLVKIDGVQIYKQELDAIDSLPGSQVKRLAFTLLCVAKYWDAVSDRNNHWVNTPDREIMGMANINTSIKRQCGLYSILWNSDLIQFSKKVDNLNVQVLFSVDSGDPEMYIKDFRNLGHQYSRRHGGSYFECGECGIVLRESRDHKGRKQKYCRSCASEIKIRQSVNSITSHRYEGK